MFKVHPAGGCFQGLWSSPESLIRVAKYVNPGMFPFGNTIGKQVQGTWKKSHPAIHSYLKNYFDLGKQFLLLCFSSLLFVAGGQGMDARSYYLRGRVAKGL